MTEDQMTDMMTLDRNREELDQMSERLRRTTRWTLIGVGISVLAVIVAGISLGVWGASLGTDNDRNAWDDATRANESCVVNAATRADTITLEHARYDREASSIDADEATVDLIETNVLTVLSVSGLPPDAPIAVNAVANIANRRARLADDRAALVAARADFDAKRPPLDKAKCPPAPAGPRP